MAIRYSGDVEVRLSYQVRTRRYTGRVRSVRGFSLVLGIDEATVRQSTTVTRKSAPRSSEGYDAVARVFLDVARRWAGKRGVKLPLAFGDDGVMEVRRTFQAPCPVRIKRRWDDGR